MISTEKSLIFDDLFRENTLSKELRSAMQLDLNQKVQIVKLIRTADPHTSTTGETAHKYSYAQTQCNSHDTELWVQDKNKKYVSVDPGDIKFVYN